MISSNTPQEHCEAKQHVQILLWEYDRSFELYFHQENILLFVSVQVFSIINSNALMKSFCTQPCQIYQWDFCRSKDCRTGLTRVHEPLSQQFAIAIFLSICPNLQCESFCKLEEN